MSALVRALRPAARPPPSSTIRFAHALPAEAPARPASAATRRRSGRTAVKVAGGVFAALSAGVYVRAAPPAAFPSSLWAPNISAAEVQAHTTPDSCWVIIDGSVYDATDWLAHHPAGAGAILAHAGQDVSEVFRHVHRPGVRAAVQVAGKLKPVGVADPAGQRIAGQ